MRRAAAGDEVAHRGAGAVGAVRHGPVADEAFLVARRTRGHERPDFGLGKDAVPERDFRHGALEELVERRDGRIVARAERERDRHVVRAPRRVEVVVPSGPAPDAAAVDAVDEEVAPFVLDVEALHAEMPVPQRGVVPVSVGPNGIRDAHLASLRDGRGAVRVEGEARHRPAGRPVEGTHAGDDAPRAAGRRLEVAPVPHRERERIGEREVRTHRNDVVRAVQRENPRRQIRREGRRAEALDGRRDGARSVLGPRLVGRRGGDAEQRPLAARVERDLDGRRRAGLADERPGHAVRRERHAPGRRLRANARLGPFLGGRQREVLAPLPCRAAERTVRAGGVRAKRRVARHGAAAVVERPVGDETLFVAAQAVILERGHFGRFEEPVPDGHLRDAAAERLVRAGRVRRAADHERIGAGLP